MLYPATKQEIARFGPTVRRLKPWGPRVSAACRRITRVDRMYGGDMHHHGDCEVARCGCLCHVYMIHAERPELSLQMLEAWERLKERKRVKA